MNFAGKFVMGRCMAAVFLAALLLAPSAESAKKQEIGDLMTRLEVAYTEVVKAIMISSVQDEDDISFDQAGQWSEEITQVTGLLAKLGEFEKDESALRFFRQLGERSRGIERLAKAQKWEGMMAALSLLQESCMACHRNHRN